MNQTIASPDSLLVTIVLGTLAIGLPIFFVLAIRFLWERSLNLGRSKELEKLIWQLHRIASAMEHQMNLSYPAVQPGTEEARDIAYLRQVEVQQKAAAANVAAAPNVAPAAAPVAAQASAQPNGQANVAPTPAVGVEQAPNPFPPLQPPSGETQRAGVNSMFGL
jgi:hypothetical protein